MRSFQLMTVGLCIALGARSAGAQKIKVAVSVTDSSAGRVFQSAFSAAFRALGDIVVVTTAERPEYVLDGVVLCAPTCVNPASYAASIRFYSPILRDVAVALAYRVLRSSPAMPTGAARTSLMRRAADSLADSVMFPMLDGYELTHGSWVVTWGRQRYEQAVREFVGRIDADCFDKQRALLRLVAANYDTTALKAYDEFIRSKKWLC
jgi:hypothetical protein